ncbi:MAG: penicillin-binding protein 2 [Bacteroidales bacterium]
MASKKSYHTRKYVITGFIILIAFTYLVRLFILQVPNNSYKLSAQNNVLRHITLYPSRGLIYDRNNTLLVYNEAAYDLLVIPAQVSKFDTSYFCSLLRISQEAFNRRFQKALRHSRYRPSIFLEQISKEDFAYLEENLFKFPGFYFQSRTLREYPLELAAHTLGFIGEVDHNNISKEPYYDQGDYIGKSGIEKSYEHILRGRKGSTIKIVDVFNREQGSFEDGHFDTIPLPGSNVTITMDASLQAYGEMLMENKKGSIVAIEPSSGDILTLVTSPSYDPNLLVGRVRSHNYEKLLKDSLRPLMNRATMGTYSPGSTFKILNALIGLQESVLYPETQYHCSGPESRPIRCTHYHQTPLQLKGAIMHSCNPYFWNVFRSIFNQPGFQDNISNAYTVWRDHVTSFGFGKKFETDIPFEMKGNIPLASVYDRIYGKERWTALTIRSLAIGQGEILVTPLQMANFSAILANRGYYYPPHFLKEYTLDGNKVEAQYGKQYSSVIPENFDVIIEAMQDVIGSEHGTAHWVRIPGLTFCGKTGTVENPHGKDHSMFIAFAPKEDPAIALCVIVENAGYGSTWAAPIASLMIEKYITGDINRTWMEQRILESNLMHDQ